MRVVSDSMRLAAEVSETPSPSPSFVATVAATTEPADSPPPGALDVQLGQGSVFHPSTLEVPAGDVVTFFLHAPPENQQPHNMAIREGLMEVARSAFLDGGESAVFTVVGFTGCIPLLLRVRGSPRGRHGWRPDSCSVTDESARGPYMCGWYEGSKNFAGSSSKSSLQPRPQK